MKITNQPLEQPSANCYRKTTALDRIYKPLLIKWLCKTFKMKSFKHDHTDQWISYSIWDRILSISLDLRQIQQINLKYIIPEKFFGNPQYQTLKMVNLDTFYIDIKTIVSVQYPKIKSYKCLGQVRSKDNDGDIMCVYHWEVYLEDDSSIYYTNQMPTMDLDYRDFTYDCYMQSRAIEQFLEKNYK